MSSQQPIDLRVSGDQIVNPDTPALQLFIDNIRQAMQTYVGLVTEARKQCNQSGEDNFRLLDILRAEAMDTTVVDTVESVFDNDDENMRLRAKKDAKRQRNNAFLKARRPFEQTPEPLAELPFNPDRSLDSQKTLAAAVRHAADQQRRRRDRARRVWNLRERLRTMLLTALRQAGVDAQTCRAVERTYAAADNLERIEARKNAYTQFYGDLILYRQIGLRGLDRMSATKAEPPTPTLTDTDPNPS